MMAELSQSSACLRVRKALASVAQLPDWILLTIEAWRERFRLRRELDDLRLHGELDRTLADSLISPLDIPRLMTAHPGTSRQLADMMRRQGIDRTALPPTTTLRDIEWRCGACADWRKCRAWLASREAPESYRAFCPNAEAFDALRRTEAAGSYSSLRRPSRSLAGLKTVTGVDARADGG